MKNLCCLLVCRKQHQHQQQDRRSLTLQRDHYKHGSSASWKRRRKFGVFLAMVMGCLVWYVCYLYMYTLSPSTGNSQGEGILITSSSATSTTALSTSSKVSQQKQAQAQQKTNDKTAEKPDRGSDDANPKQAAVELGASAVSTMPACETNAQTTQASTELVWQAFESTVKLLDKLGVDYWLSAGTLLGFVRNCSHIHYDLDFAIDLRWLQQRQLQEMLLVETFMQTNPGQFRHNKFFKGVDGTTLSEGAERNFVFENNGNIKVDFFHSLRTQNFFRNGYNTERGLFSCPRPMQYVQSFQWRNLKVPVPMPYQDVLKATYGVDYMTPQKRRKRKDHFLWKATDGGCLIVRPGRAHRHYDDKIGILTCLVTTSATSEQQVVAQARALVQSLRKWEAPVTLELYHYETLTDTQKTLIMGDDYLLDDDKVRFVQLDSNNQQEDDESHCYEQALATTSLEHVLLVRPSIIFLRNPLHWVYTAHYVHERDCKCQTTCATSTVWELLTNKPCVRFHANQTTPTLITQDDSVETEIAVFHSSVHRSLNWAYPTPHYYDTTNTQQSFDAVSLLVQTTGEQRAPLAEEYEPHVRHHRKSYHAAWQQQLARP
ncbi:regulation of protein glycosylation [Seminavis robusta]|uniref:Regulation of protein glycosylation n=1 Tax=Seminavis robusta TaxID=568900 RepID=A0A9N8ETV7_9STRA|nr:regulation of protein glycosylation [Seminavis robusta]|eukprot:Sro1613_g286020.1 regulation of protein glycosylation (601) ;mRNA; r:12962-14764